MNLSDKGSDWQYTRVLAVPSEGPPEELADHVKYVKYCSPSWTADNLGFFYSGYALSELVPCNQSSVAWEGCLPHTSCAGRMDGTLASARRHPAPCTCVRASSCACMQIRQTSHGQSRNGEGCQREPQGDVPPYGHTAGERCVRVCNARQPHVAIGCASNRGWQVAVAHCIRWLRAGQPGLGCGPG